jgi:hypothetical protein
VLRETDTKYLDERGHRFSTYEDGNLTLLVIEGYELPVGYTPEAVDLLIQIPRDYPDANLDMWWMFPAVGFTHTGTEPVATEVRQPFAGYALDPTRLWQRFSRHPNWRPGVDDLHTFLASLRSTMENEAMRVAA